MELFAKIFNGLNPLTTLAKSSILNVWLSFEYASNLAAEIILNNSEKKHIQDFYIYNLMCSPDFFIE